MLQNSEATQPPKLRARRYRRYSRFVLLASFSAILSCTVVPLIKASPANASRDLEFDINTCYTTNFSQPVLWGNSGAWANYFNDDLRDAVLLVADVLRSEILQIQIAERDQIPAGQVSSFVKARDKLELPADVESQWPSRPSRIRQMLDGSLLIEDDADERILKVNSYQDASIAPHIDPMRIGGYGSIRRIYDWVPLGDGVLAFADLLRPGDQWESAFVYISRTEGVRAISPIGRYDEIRNQYHRNMPYLASIGERAYILHLSAAPTITEVTASGKYKALPFFPREFQYRPPLVRVRGRGGAREATEFYKILERSPGVAGIYSFHSRVFILGKGAAAQSTETEWWLIEIDTEDGSELGRSPLPTRAPNLTVVPGEWWALIEKGPVQEIGLEDAPYMNTTSVVLVSKYWIEDRLSSHSRQESLTKCIEIGPRQNLKIGPGFREANLPGNLDGGGPRLGGTGSAPETRAAALGG